MAGWAGIASHGARIAALAFAGLACVLVPGCGRGGGPADEISLFGLGERTAHEGPLARSFRRVNADRRWRSAIGVGCPGALTIRGVEAPDGGELELFPWLDGNSWAERREVFLAVELEANGRRETLARFRFGAEDPPGRDWRALGVAIPPLGKDGATLLLRAEGKALEDPMAGAVWIADPVLRVPRRRTRRAESPRGILVAVFDCLRADRLSCAGYPRPTTPVLDRLAAEGRRYARATSTTSWTKPAIASLFTGLYPLRHGVVDPLGVLPEHLPTLAGGLQSAGYRTAGFVTNCVVGPAPFKYGRGFDVWEHIPGDSATIRRAALTWIAEHRDRPFFVYYHTVDTHAPYEPPESFGSRFVSDYRFDDEPASSRPALDFARASALYDATIASADADFGLFLDGLRRLGVYDATTIVATADHGEGFGAKGLAEHGNSLHGELVRIPLIIRGGRGVDVPRGVSTFPASLVDLAPTLLRTARVAAPPGMEGVNLLVADSGADGDAREVFHEVGFGGDYFHAVRRWPWKLVLRYSPSGLSRRLFHLDRDPDEREELAERFPARADELEGRIREYRATEPDGEWAVVVSPPGFDEEFELRVSEYGMAPFEPRTEGFAPEELRAEPEGAELVVRGRVGREGGRIVFSTHVARPDLEFRILVGGRPIAAEEIGLGHDRSPPASGEAFVATAVDAAAAEGRGDAASPGSPERRVAITCHTWRAVEFAALDAASRETLKALGYVR